MQQIRIRPLVLAGAAFLALAGPLMAAAGTLDPSFGTAGIFVSSSGNLAEPAAAALQSNGQILVAGQINGNPGVLRLNANGTPDSTFGSNGIAIATEGGNASGGAAIGVAVQPNGQIVIGISTQFADEDNGFTLARFNANGTLDSTFGRGGYVTAAPFNNLALAPAVMAVQPNGDFVLAGDGVIGRFIGSQPDAAFGSGGFAHLPFNNVTAIAVAPDGGILVGSGGLQLGQFPPYGSPVTGALARLTPAGALDTTFGISGQSASLASVAAIAIQSNGQPVVAGTIVNQSQGSEETGFGLVRFNTNGTIDTTFGSNGGVVSSLGGNALADAFALVILPNGGMVAAGRAGPATGSFPPSSLALARYSSTGAVDVTFGSAASVTTNLNATALAYVTALVVQPNGAIVGAGVEGNSRTFTSNMIVVRYLGQ